MGIPIGYLAVSGAAAYSLMHYPHLALTFSVVALAIYFLYGIMGMVANAVCSPDVDNVFGIVSNVVETLPIGLIATELYFGSKKFKEVAYAHSLIGAVPVVLDFVMEDCQIDKFKDLSVFINSVSLIFLGVEMKNHPCYIVLGLVTLLIQFGHPQIADKLEIPKNYVLPIGYSLICILTYMIINGLCKL